MKSSHNNVSLIPSAPLPPQRQAELSTLPPELVLIISKHLKFREKVELSGVNKWFRALLSDEIFEYLSAPYQAWVPALESFFPIQKMANFLYHYPKNDLSRFVFNHYSSAWPSATQLNEITLFLHSIISKPNEYHKPPRFDRLLDRIKFSPINFQELFIASSILTLFSYYKGLPLLSLLLRCFDKGFSPGTQQYTLFKKLKPHVIQTIALIVGWMLLEQHKKLRNASSLMNAEKANKMHELQRFCRNNNSQANLEYKECAEKLIDAHCKTAYHPFANMLIMATVPLAAPGLLYVAVTAAPLIASLTSFAGHPMQYLPRPHDPYGIRNFWA